MEASTYGSALVGLVISATLYGATILQTNYPKDARYIKVLVGSVYLVTNYNNPPALSRLTCVHRRQVIPAHRQYYWNLILTADVIIAVALCFYLLKSRTGFTKQATLFILSNIIGVAIVITFATMPNNYVWLAFFWIDGKCYVNSCLAALNSRVSLREKAAPAESFLQLSPINISGADSRSLTKLPGVREFHLHVLVSSPRKHSSLYPFSKPKCRSYLQDIFILLSEQSTPDSPRILVTAIEGCVYNVPATSCALLYISKVDSTGQCTLPSPTATLVRALLLYYGDISTRPVPAAYLWIQLFARAQSQYLFPNSADFSGKRPLGDFQLCGWWKRVFTDVALELRSRSENPAGSAATIRLFYLLPGYSQIEAEHSLRPVTATRLVTHNYQWAYGHPYSQTEIPLPCIGNDTGTAPRNLGQFIPSFDDDPKSRFMDEIAYTTGPEGIKSPPRKRARTASSASHGGSTAAITDEGSASQAETNDHPLGELGKVSVDEFWERMSFRQECVAGAVTGFFAMGIASSRVWNDSERSAVSPLAPQPGQVPSQMNKRIITSLMTGVEFSTRERAIRATEVIETAVRGLCEGIAAVPASIIHVPRPTHATENNLSSEQAVGASLLAPPRTPPPRMTNGSRVIIDVSPNPFPEPETSLETYESFIYGSACVSNADSQDRYTSNENKEAELSPVTVLAVRRKKKRQD
ncbi:histone acetylation protein-domain-containing protein [Rhodocollybia butyracea]|uniref:histone acetyltransferase n=1 Tax=Rhodocollybia butyracea TaxID=206335 RepID=A0A9P5Q380_9AGAR|nr:histone acetylation protein-domain-containing protein [Rhodocollybia butyracea]